MDKKKIRAKLAFATEFSFNYPTTQIKKINTLGYGAEYIAAKPRAFHMKNFPVNSLPWNILGSKDGSVLIKALSLNGGLKSGRMLNADGDELWYAAGGNGYCRTIFGMFKFCAGDYIFIPKACTYYFQMISQGTDLLVGIESESEFIRPNFGDFGNRNVPYPPEAIEKPMQTYHADMYDREGEWDLYVKRLGKYVTKITYSFSPFLENTWQGDKYPFLLHTSDINTLVSPTVHLDPSAFATFISKDKTVVISTFKPRWIHSLPYNHMNYYDEFLFYGSKYEARGNLIGEGDATFHPQGVWHGPQTEALLNEKTHDKPQDSPWREELAIMFESKKPLVVSDLALDRNIEIQNYWESWRG